jgi:hypothetical protein
VCKGLGSEPQRAWKGDCSYSANLNPPIREWELGADHGAQKSPVPEERGEEDQATAADGGLGPQPAGPSSDNGRESQPQKDFDG